MRALGIQPLSMVHFDDDGQGDGDGDGTCKQDLKSLLAFFGSSGY